MASAKDVHANETIRRIYKNFVQVTPDDDTKRNPEYCYGLGYSDEDIQNVPDGVNMNLGCGNPIAEGGIKKGEFVLDIGSGPGFDCFLAAQRVGKDGFVIGVDLTPEMIHKARTCANREGCTNIEFRLGEAEALPVQDKCIDIIISNAAINMFNNKPRVFGEMMRVLKPGGRICLVDIVAKGPVPQETREYSANRTGCVAGCLALDKYKPLLQSAGFVDVEVNSRTPDLKFFDKWVPGIGAEKYLTWAVIKAKRP